MTSSARARPLRLLGENRDLRLLLGASVVSLTGDWILGIGLAYQVYAVTGSTLASAATLIAAFVPQLLLSTVAGVFVDRWDRKRTMVAANLLLAVGLAPLVLGHPEDHVWVVYVVLVWESVIEVFFAPAEQALLPRVVGEEDLVSANALNSQVQQVARLLGSALGGLAAGTAGITGVAVLDGLTFLLATALILRIRTAGTAEPAVMGEAVTGEAASGEAAMGAAVLGGADAGLGAGSLARLAQEWRDGLRVAWSKSTLRLLLVFGLITSTGEGVMGTLFAPFVHDVLHGGGGIYGVITSVQAIGGILGGMAVAAFAHRLEPRWMLGLGAVAFGVVDLALFLYPLVLASPWPAVLLMIVVGLPGAVTMAGFMTLFQTSTTDSHRGRVYGVLTFVRTVAMLVGTVGAGVLGEAVGIVPVIAFQGLGYVVAGGLVLVLMRTSVAVERGPRSRG